MNKLTLSVDQILCNQVTGWFGLADDNIALGGVTVDNLGNVGTIAPIQLGDFSNSTAMPGPNPFASFTIDAQSNWPKTYSVTLVLAEQQSGGIYQYIIDLANAAKSYIAKLITTSVTGLLLGGTIGGSIGSIFPGAGTVIGAVIGAAFGYLIGLVFSWIEGLFSDEIFTPMVANLTLPSLGAEFDGSPVGSLNWDEQGFGGDYTLNAHWQLAWGALNVDACWHIQWNANDWGGWQSLGGVFNDDPAIASWANGRLDVFTIGQDQALWHIWFENGGWSLWEKVGGSLTSGPAAVSWLPNQIDVFARGTDNAIWRISYGQLTTGGSISWGDWVSLGGGAISPPAVASWAPGRLDVFAVRQDNALWHTWSEFGGLWSAWESLGGTLTSGPAAVSWGPNRIDVVARGTDNAVWHLAYDGAGGGWGAWESRGGTFEYRPGISSWGAGRLDVFATGPDNALRHSWFDNGRWSAWESLGGTLTSSPAAVSWGVNRIDVVARGD